MPINDGDDYVLKELPGIPKEQITVKSHDLGVVLAEIAPEVCEPVDLQERVFD